jgi:hypothetical protein
MPKTKPGTQFSVADGAGGMRPVSDLRDDQGDWPVTIRVPSRRAVDWMAHLYAECEARGYSWSELSQLDSAENSGTVQIRLRNGADAPEFALVWERLRNKDLTIKARPGGEPLPALAELRAFLGSVLKAVRANRQSQVHRRQYLVYRGLPWLGELWLSPNLCLGPPTIPAEYQNDPQINVLDAMIRGIGSRGIQDEFRRVVREVLIFLDVVAGLHAVEQKEARVWVYRLNPAGQYSEFKLEGSAYYECELNPSMPEAGKRRAIPLVAITRPGVRDLTAQVPQDEKWVRQDTTALWHQLQSLPTELRTQYLEAGNAYALAQSFWPDQRPSPRFWLSRVRH